MEFHDGMDFIDDYVTDDAVYVLERLVELRDNADYGIIRNIIFDSKNREEATKRIIQEQEGITFNQLIDIRVFVDETVRDILRFLGNAVGFVKINEFNLMVNMVIGEWIITIERSNGTKKLYNKVNFAGFGDLTYITLKVRRDLWEKLKETGKHSGLNKEECLKVAIITFLDSRYSLCREMLM